MNDLLQQRSESFTFTKTRHVTWAEIEAFCHAQAALCKSFDLLIGVLRYGAPIAVMLSRYSGVPHDYVLLNATFREPLWLADKQSSPHNKRLLLVDDTCGTGFSFRTLKTFFEASGNTVKTLSMFYSKERYVPDYGQAIAQDVYIQWPWDTEADPYRPPV